MLQKIRDRISGWVAGVIIALIAGAFIFWGIEYYFVEGERGSQNAATVNGVAVTHQAVDRYYNTLQRELAEKNHNQPISSLMQQELKSYALQTIITQTALLNVLESEHFGISLTQIKAMVERTPQFQIDGQFSSEKFLQTLAQIDLSPSEFFEQMRSQWIVGQTLNGVAASNFALPSEAAHWYGLLHQKRAFGYFLIPVNNFLGKTLVADAAIQAYYQDHKAEFETPAQVRVAYLLISPKDLEKKITVTETEAKEYYESNIQNYQVAERWKVTAFTVPVDKAASPEVVKKAETQAENIANALTHGTSVEKIISDKKNKNVTHATQSVSAVEIAPALKTILSGLTMHQVSKPVRVQNGFAVLQLLQHDTATTHSFASVKNTVMQALQRQKVNVQLTQESSKLSDLTYTNPDSLTPASTALHLSIQESGLMTQAGEKAGVFSNPAVMSAVFSPSVFESGNNSDVISLNNGDQLVLRVKEKVPSSLIPLKQVSAKIKTKLAEQGASDKAGLLAYQLQQDLSKGVDPKTLAQKNNLVWQTVPLASAIDKSAASIAIVHQAFITPLSTANSKSMLGSLATLLDPAHYIVIGITQVQNGNANANTDDSAIQQQLTGIWSELSQRYFVASVMQQTKVKVTDHRS